jgi:hypothetical protein
MKKHLIPDQAALSRLPYRLLQESWWLEDNSNLETRIPPSSISQDRIRRLQPQKREVPICN